MQNGPGDVDYRSLLGLDHVITQAQAYGALFYLHLCHRHAFYLLHQMPTVGATPLRTFVAESANIYVTHRVRHPAEVLHSRWLQNLTAALCGAAPGMKVLLSLADNWKYPGGVDQYVDWSATTPERGAAHPRPPDTEGDTDNTVRRVASDVSDFSRARCCCGTQHWLPAQQIPAHLHRTHQTYVQTNS